MWGWWFETLSRSLWRHYNGLGLCRKPSDEHIGETKRSLPQRFKEHKKLYSPTGVGDHYLATGRSVSIHNIIVLAKEKQRQERKAKGGIYIKQKAPMMNYSQGYQQLPIYNKLDPPCRGIFYATKKQSSQWVVRICSWQIKMSHSFQTLFCNEQISYYRWNVLVDFNSTFNTTSYVYFPYHWPHMLREKSQINLDSCHFQ